MLKIDSNIVVEIVSDSMMQNPVEFSGVQFSASKWVIRTADVPCGDQTTSGAGRKLMQASTDEVVRESSGCDTAPVIVGVCSQSIAMEIVGQASIGALDYLELHLILSVSQEGPVRLRSLNLSANCTKAQILAAYTVVGAAPIDPEILEDTPGVSNYQLSQKFSGIGLDLKQLLRDTADSKEHLAVLNTILYDESPNRKWESTEIPNNQISVVEGSTVEAAYDRAVCSWRRKETSTGAITLIPQRS